MPDANGSVSNGAAPVAEPPTIRFVQYKKHTKTVRYKAVDDDAAVTDIYVGFNPLSKTGDADGMPKMLLVTIQPA
jgi:hypothetical protein